jgi:hypothetical protein
VRNAGARFYRTAFPPGPAVDADGKFAFVNIDYGGDLFAVGADIRFLNPLVVFFPGAQGYLFFTGLPVPVSGINHNSSSLK